jgi:hypothetical protein
MDIDLLSKYLAPVTVGFVAAYLGSQLALSKFKKETIWFERRKYYKEVIEAFEELVHWSEQVRASHFFEPTIGGEAKFQESLRLISKCRLTGGFLAATEFQQAVEELYTAIVKSRFKVEEESRRDSDTDQVRAEWNLIQADEIRVIVEKGLPKLIKIASSTRL